MIKVELKCQNCHALPHIIHASSSKFICVKSVFFTSCKFCGGRDFRLEITEEPSIDEESSKFIQEMEK